MKFSILLKKNLYLLRPLLLFVSVFSSLHTSAQDKSFALGITGGMGNMFVRDQVFNTYLYKAKVVPIGFHFESRKTNQKATFNLEFFNSPVFETETNKGLEYKGDLGDFYSTEQDGYTISNLKSKLWNFNYTQLFLLQKTREKKIQFYMGFDLNLIKFQKEFLQFAYINTLTDRIYTLGLVFNLERKFNEKHLLMYNLSIPVFSNTKRTLYNPDSDPSSIKSSAYGALSKCVGLDSRITYQYMLSRKFSLRASFICRYMRVSFPATEKWFISQGELGLFLHL